MNTNRKKKKTLEREEIPTRFRWDIESLYPNQNDWEKDIQEINQLLDKLGGMKPTFLKNALSLFHCLQLKDQILQLFQHVFTYAEMRKDEDNENNQYQTLFMRANDLSTKIENHLSFIEPAILTLDDKKLALWLKQNPSLKTYQHYLNGIFRKKEHILSHKEEAIIAQSTQMAIIPENTFNMLSYADILFPRVKNGFGKMITLTHSNFVPLLRNENRHFRRKVFKAYYKPYQNFKHTFASLLAGNIKKDIFFSQVRNYNDSLSAALFENNIPVEVYYHLIEVVHKHIYLLHKYMSLKRKILDLPQLHMYDLYVPLVQNPNKRISYLRSQKMVLEGLKPLGKNYLSVAKKGFKERWIDVYENRGKTSGAYSTSVYGKKPFILLNFQDTLEDVYTIAHEMGHSIHSYYTHQNQPFIYSNYSIFLAEIASTTNETLLTYYFLEQLKDKENKLFVLNHFLEQFRTTLFRQTMFAEFEKMIHDEAVKGKALTAERLSSLYHHLNSYYYGDQITVDSEIDLEWARIPHFYYNYYIYQYATGFASAISISQKILQEGTSVVDQYIRFLSKGSSDYPIPVLKKAGVDMTGSQPIEDAMRLFNQLLSELERLMNEST